MTVNWEQAIPERKTGSYPDRNKRLGRGRARWKGNKNKDFIYVKFYLFGHGFGKWIRLKQWYILGLCKD